MTTPSRQTMESVEKVLAAVPTPAVLVDHARLRRNIRAMAAKARAHGLALRPHIKTHKSLEIARLQLAEGAAGITASKPEEALVFLRGGICSVTVAYPVLDPEKLDALFAASHAPQISLRLIADSAEGIDAIASASARHGRTTDIFLKIDVGLHRCGVKEDAPEVLEFARRIAACPALRFAGLLSHAGHAYAAASREEVCAIAREETAILARVRRRLESTGIAVREVSVGATPTVLASDDFSGITEIRPGNYVFLDRTPVRLGVADADAIALTVLATVVSRNSDFYIIDAGSKVLSSDLGPHGTSGAPGYGLAVPFPLSVPLQSEPRSSSGSMSDGSRLRLEMNESTFTIAKLSEEHGFIVRAGTGSGSPRALLPLPLGSRVRIIPNHACPVVNLAKELVVVREEEKGAARVERWNVDARGCVH